MERFTTVDGESVNTITFAEPIHTRYIKMQGVSLNGNNTFKLREFEAYEAVDRTALKEQVKAAKEKCEEFGLTFADAKGYDAFMDAYMKAEAMYENALAEQNDVNAAASTLKEALESIQDKPNPKPEAYKSKLEELYKECFEAYKEVDYTKDSWNDFLEAMKKTDTVLKDENVTQEDVDAAKAALEDAVNRLEKVSEEEDNKGPEQKPDDGKDNNSQNQSEGDGDNSQNQSAGEDKKKDTVKTGDPQSAVWCLGAMAAAGMAVVGRKKKRD